MNRRRKVVRHSWNDAIDPKKNCFRINYKSNPGTHIQHQNLTHTTHTHAYRDTGVDEIVDKASKAFTAELLPEKLGMCAFFHLPLS